MIDGEVIAIGDGYTDYLLYEKGYETKFIAYMEHIEREKVINLSNYVARNVAELASLIM
ncbi:phosphoserine phosphatase, partial [Francisella tularensis subsp. holarctica]|nr:phosphoserine phosphatase [Francisella tularensis subsp. holarctica]